MQEQDCSFPELSQEIKIGKSTFKMLNIEKQKELMTHGSLKLEVKNRFLYHFFFDILLKKKKQNKKKMNEITSECIIY